MSFQTRTTPELVSIAAAKGGFRLDAGVRSTPDLARIAAAASNSGARLVFAGMKLRSTPDLIKIAAAGGGNVVFED